MNESDVRKERVRLFQLFESVYTRDADVIEAFIYEMETEFAAELKESGTWRWYENE